MTEAPGEGIGYPRFSKLALISCRRFSFPSTSLAGQNNNSKNNSNNNNTKSIQICDFFFHLGPNRPLKDTAEHFSLYGKDPKPCQEMSVSVLCCSWLLLGATMTGKLWFPSCKVWLPSIKGSQCQLAWIRAGPELCVGYCSLSQRDTSWLRSLVQNWLIKQAG